MDEEYDAAQEYRDVFYYIEELIEQGDLAQAKLVMHNWFGIALATASDYVNDILEQNEDDEVGIGNDSPITILNLDAHQDMISKGMVVTGDFVVQDADGNIVFEVKTTGGCKCDGKTKCS